MGRKFQRIKDEERLFPGSLERNLLYIGIMNESMMNIFV